MVIVNPPVELVGRKVDPLPGLKSPWFWGPLLLGVGLLLFAQNELEGDLAIYALASAGTALMTDNKTVRCASIFGGSMRVCGSAFIRGLGSLVQGGALVYAAKESINTVEAEAPQV